MNKIKVLDLGSGPRPYKSKNNENVINVDFNPEMKPTVVHDLSEIPYPFKDNEFDKIYMGHILEHMKDTIKFMEEIYRIAKPNAKLIIRVPHFSCRGAWSNPTHYRAFAYEQFFHFSRDKKEHYGNCNFKVQRLELRYSLPDEDCGFLISKIITPLLNFFANKNLKFCERIWCYWVGGFSEIYVELRTIK
ncbi:MAG: class I SAM-dependent methyltransferase [Nanoarchaeota archaeon]|nr:class I SAM-dependent methyltransferase [Nanoarchaeota archaeon]